MGRAYVRALLSRKRAQAVVELPELRATVGPLTLEASDLATYREVCGHSAPVPASYPQLLVTPVHVALLTDPAFPLPVMGLVHPRCRVIQHRPLRLGEQVELTAGVEGLREVRNGLEFDLVAEVVCDGETIWESRAATFSRTGTSMGRRPPEPDPSLDGSRPFVVPGDAGRRYARVSGDANPVHLHRWLARLFGYRQAIAHGWWLLARVLGELEPADVEALTLDLQLLRPVFLGETLMLHYRRDEGGTTFAVRDDVGKTRLSGRLVLP